MVIQLTHRASKAAKNLAQRRKAPLIDFFSIYYCPMQIKQCYLWHAHLTEAAKKAARGNAPMRQTRVILQDSLGTALTPERATEKAALVAALLLVAAAVTEAGCPLIYLPTPIDSSHSCC